MASKSPAIADEDGAVLVLVAIALPVLVLLVAFAIDVGNWFAHRRHLQTQADAAAFAGAIQWGGCFGDTTTANAAIDAAARRYSGDATGSYNEQLGGTPADEIHYALNSATFEPKPDNPGPSDDTVKELPPCEAAMVDVKMTETDLPVLFQVLPFDSVGYINTHARVEIFQRERLSGALPFGVPDPNPKVGRVIFVDEANLDTNGNPTVLGSAPLTKQGAQDGLLIWDNSASPFALPVNSAHIGVRIAFGGATSTTCGDPLVECYELGGPNGLLHVRGYSTAGSGAQPGEPLARSVQLTSETGGCADPYFVNIDESCGIGVRAEVDFGSFASCADLVTAVGPRLVAQRAGSNTDYELTCESVTGSTSVWTTSGVPIPVEPDEGPVDVELLWEETKGSLSLGGTTKACKTSGNNPCEGTFGPVQRTFAATEERTGTIRLAQLWENGAAGANSLEQCPTSEPCHAVVARFGVDPNLDNAETVNDPLVTLRLGDESGSQNRALDCDTDPWPSPRDFRDEIAYGCRPEYERNNGAACPEPNVLQASPEPWQCVAVETGDRTGQLAQALNLRVHGDEKPSGCVSPNNWETSFPNFTGDPRAVDLFLTPYGSFGGSGNDTVPVTGFAKFYITGWHGSDQICPGDATTPADDPAPPKSMVGHFISYLESINDGTAGDDPCDPSQLGSCIPVMTR